MNRKQKVAVVVGVVVIVLLVLFPPWTVDRLAYQDDFPDRPMEWDTRHGPTWIGCPPDHPNQMVRADIEYRRNLREEHPDELEAVNRHLPTIPKVIINWAQLVPHVLAALALTVAAVVVLKERKA